MRKAHEISGPLLFPSSLMTAAGRSDEVAVFVGGTIPPRDIEQLERLGAADVFPTGTPLSAIAPAIRTAVVLTSSSADFCRRDRPGPRRIWRRS